MNIWACHLFAKESIKVWALKMDKYVICFFKQFFWDILCTYLSITIFIKQGKDYYLWAMLFSFFLF